MGKKIKLNDLDVKKLEIISIVFLILIAIIFKIISTYISRSSDKREIAIFSNGYRITQVEGKDIDLTKDMTFTIGKLDGEYNVIEIKDGRVCCIDANCPDKICVSHGSLSPDYDNDMIVCAPHKLVIQYK